MSDRLNSKSKPGFLRELIGIAAAVVFSAGQYVMLEYSCDLKMPLVENIINKYSGFLALNILAIFVIQLVIRFVVGKWSRALLISTVLMIIWSIANYYTVLYHGSPLFPSELRSVGTAFEVMGDYSYEIDRHVKFLIIAGAVLLIVSVFYLICERKSKAYTIVSEVCTALGIAACVFCLYVYLFSSKKITPEIIVGWNWKEGVQRYGFGVTVIDDADKMIHSISMPEGYSAEKVKEYDPVGIEASTEQYPDIILILNETFYCMDDYIDTGADVDYMEGFYGIDNAIYGHSAASRVGGGTNDSEFEILTGNAMALMKSYAPFNYFNFNSYFGDYVHCLKELGYSTLAMHAAKGTNYNRSSTYPKLGFDETVLGSESFKHHDFQYGNRTRTDSDNYKDLIDHYNEQGEGPRFAYLLTFQNHGGYEKNDDDLDVVHVSKDFGDLTDDMNEFLSAISYSSKAFTELVEYYRTVDRPVIICMTGDHSPSFITDLKSEGYSEQEKALKTQMVPYVIWSNYDIDTKGIYTENTTHYELMAMVCRMAGLPMTPYQKTILDLHDELPVLTNGGICMDKNGNIIDRSEAENQDLIDKYYYLEYNSLKRDSGYRKEMFTLP